MKNLLKLMVLCLTLTVLSCQDQIGEKNDPDDTRKEEFNAVVPEAYFQHDDEFTIDTEPVPTISFIRNVGNNDGREEHSELFMKVPSEEILNKHFPSIKTQHLPDFEKNIVFVYSIGKQSTANCYSADVYDVFYMEDNTLNIFVTYKEPSPIDGEGCKCDLAESSPFVVVEVPYSELSKIISDSPYQYIFERVPSYKSCK
ncbi:MAG TPA: hypothetical protein PLV42_09825 [bacterium]|nr:hypothetical protein [bacterium]